MNMNLVFVVLKLLVEVSLVVSYTVVLKPVKHLHPSVKVYRYDLRHPKIITDGNTQYIYHKPLLGQRLYPVVLKTHNRGRSQVKKEKKKFIPKVPSTTENPPVKDQRVFNLPQQLVPPVSNQIEEYSESKEEENDVRPLLVSPHKDKSFSSFPQEKGRIYSKPGEWAKPAVPLSAPVAAPSESENSTQPVFTPSQLYLQIRHKNTVIHVPQTEALKDAETLEELINAPRLKELARTTHVQETYSEEGYEDAGYDHAGQIRHAQHGEVYDAKDEGKFRIKEPPVIIDYDSDLEETKKIHSKKVNTKFNTAEVEKENGKPEPRITHSQAEGSKTSTEFAKIPPTYKGEHKYSSRVKAPLNFQDQDAKVFNFTENKEPLPVFPTYFGELPPPPPENIFTNQTSIPLQPIFQGKKSSKYRKSDLNSTKIFPVAETIAPSLPTQYTDFKPYLSVIDSQASPSAKSVKYSRIYSKKTKQLKLEPYKTGDIYKPPPPPPPPPLNPQEDVQLPPTGDAANEGESINQRIVLPTIGYINSLTTAHFGKGSVSPVQEEAKTQLTSALNLTQALNYLRSNNKKLIEKPTEPPTISDIRTFEPMKLKKVNNFMYKIKRDVYLIKERNKRSEDSATEGYEGNDDSDEPHNDKNEEIAEDERKRIEEENLEKEQYEKELREEISQKEKEILRETYKNIGVEEDISEVFPELPQSDFDSDDAETLASETEPPVDKSKYPYYFMRRLPENSALRYATNQKTFPMKSGYKMEFYDSREDVIQCPDFHPDLEDLPDSNSTEYSEDQAGETERLTGVGDKIMCLRSKYFDPDPFDNPIFKEKEIDYVGKPKRRLKFEEKKVKPSPSRLESKRVENLKNRNAVNQTSEVKNQKAESSPVKIKYKSTQFVQPDPYKSTTRNTKNTNSINKNTTAPNPQSSGWKGFEISYEIPAKINYTPQKQTTTPRQVYIPFNRMILPHNCLPIISKLAVLDGRKNVTVDCKDAVLIQQVVNDIAHVRIIPKAQQTDTYTDQSDWVPIVGYPRSHRFRVASRKTDEVKIVKDKNETSSNSSSDHYVIDELKEDENVRKGEVVEDMDHYLSLMKELTTAKPEETTVDVEIMKTTNTTTRKKREAQADLSLNKKKTGKSGVGKQPESDLTPISRPLEEKRPLKRLSGLDFLTRYHKNKGKPQGKTADFWKVSESTTSSKNLSPAKESAKVSIKRLGGAQKPVLAPVTEKLIARPEIKKPKEIRKITQLNIIPEKITKRPEVQTLEFRAVSATEPTTERVTRKPEIKASDFRTVPFTETTTEKAIRRLEIKASDFRTVPFTETTTEKAKRRLEVKASEFRKAASTEPVVERGARRFEIKASDFRKATTFEPETTTPEKVITKVSREISETSEKPRVVHIKAEEITKKIIKTENESVKPETVQYKTINRNSKKNETEEVSRFIESTDGPILYYVVDGRTGRGKWITNYEERRKSSGKLRKTRKLVSRSKNDKRRKKQRNSK